MLLKIIINIKFQFLTTVYVKIRFRLLKEFNLKKKSIVLTKCKIVTSMFGVLLRAGLRPPELSYS